jgi:hypothetical protein
MDAITLLALVALTAGILVAATQKVWPVVLLCGGLFMAVLASAGLITT